MRKLYSWRKRLMCFLAVILLYVLVFLYITSYNFYRQSAEQNRAGNMKIVQIWGEATERRLGYANEHLKMLGIGIYSRNIPLYSGSREMTFFEKQDCLALIQNELAGTSDVAAFFIRDEEGDVFLMDTGSSVHHSAATSLRRWAADAQIQRQSMADGTWSVIEAGGKPYFFKTMVAGKYTVGVFGGLLDNEIGTMFEAGDEQWSCLLFDGDRFFWLEGQDWSDEIAADGSGGIQVKARDMEETGYEIGDLGLTVILLRKRFTPFDVVSSSLPLLVGAGAVIVVLMLLVIRFVNRHVSRPTEHLLTAILNIRGGNIDYRIGEAAENQEFEVLYSNFNEMAERIQNLRMEAYEQQLRMQKDELSYLRAQLRPHFYLNMLNTISSMTYENRIGDIRTYLALLANYMRYMLSQKSKMVSLGEELTHVEQYLKMQQIRYPGKIISFTGCPAGLKTLRIPYLLISTVVENSVKHAMNLYDTLMIMIQCERMETEGFSGVRIAVSDNGSGFGEEILAQFAPGGELPEAKEHFGLTNIKRTLQLSYGRNDLMRLSNGIPQGAVVEFRIPDSGTEKKECATYEDSDL